MINIKGAIGLKAILILVAILLIVYGYYGYIYVPNNSGFGTQSFGCPFGQESGGFTSVGGPCLFSLYALIIGILLIVAFVALLVLKK